MKTILRAACAASVATMMFGCGDAAEEAHEAQKAAMTEVSSQALEDLAPGSKLSMDLRPAEAVISFDLTKGPIDFSKLELIFSNGPVRVPDWLRSFPIGPGILYKQDGFLISRTRPVRSLRWPSACEACAYHPPSAWVCWNQCFQDDPTLRDLSDPPTRNHREELPDGPVNEPDTDPPPPGSGSGSGGGTTGGGSTGGGSTGGGSSGSGGGSSSGGGGHSSGGLGGGGPSTPGPGL